MEEHLVQGSRELVKNQKLRERCVQIIIQAWYLNNFQTLSKKGEQIVTDLFVQSQCLLVF